ncbi:MAG: hypothetical protein MUC99_10565, partial [Anaerolineae bacterium]|nr:hypothetical protein [Anaerolineae bacterium]
MSDRPPFDQEPPATPDPTPPPAAQPPEAKPAPDPVPDTSDLRREAASAPKSASVKLPAGIPGAPERVGLDDVQTVVTQAVEALRGQAGQQGNPDALAPSWWNIAVLVTVIGVLSGLLIAFFSAISYGSSILAILTLPIVKTLQLMAGMAGGVIASRWFIGWRGQTAADPLPHTHALIVPWFAGSAALAVLGVVGILSRSAISSFESVVLAFSLFTVNLSFVLLILALVVLAGVL